MLNVRPVSTKNDVFVVLLATSNMQWYARGAASTAWPTSIFNQRSCKSGSSRVDFSIVVRWFVQANEQNLLSSLREFGSCELSATYGSKHSTYMARTSIGRSQHVLVEMTALPCSWLKQPCPETKTKKLCSTFFWFYFFVLNWSNLAPRPSKSSSVAPFVNFFS